MLEAIEQRQVAHQLRNLRLQGRRDRRALPRCARRAPPSAASWCASSSIRSDRSLEPENRERLEKAGVQAGVVQPARLLVARRNQLPHPSQGAGRRRRRGVHRRHGRRRSLARPRAGQEHWRDTQFRITGPAVRALEGIVLRELDRIRRPLGAGARSGAAAAAHRRAVGGGVEQSHRRRQQHQAAVSAGDRRRAEDDRHPVAVHHARRSTRGASTEARERGVRIRI